MEESQQYFISAVLNKAIEPDIFLPVEDLDARIEIYRRNFMQGYIKALRKTFSMTAKYTGSVFDEVAVSYICTNRPKAGQLFVHYGDTFFQYFSDHVAQELARLEWQLQTVLIGEEDPSKDSLVEDLEGARWQLRNDVCLFESKYPVGCLYAELFTGRAGAKDLSKDFSYYILYKDEENPMVLPLNKQEYCSLSYLATPHAIDELIDRLTFSKEECVNIISRIFNANFLKVTYVSDSIHQQVCSNL